MSERTPELDRAVQTCEALTDAIGTILREKHALEQEVVWLRRACVVLLKHTAPGLKVTSAPGRPVVGMVEHPNGHVERALKYGTQRNIDALWTACDG